MKKWVKKNYGHTNSHRGMFHDTIVSKMQQKYTKTIGLNGKFYLWKLSIYEVIENWIQYYNLRSVFLCNLPFEWTSFICLILVFESGGRAYVYGKRLWFSPIDTIHVIDRDTQILSDMFVDLFFLILPLALMRLVYDSTSIVPTVALQIILPPGFSLFGKLRFTVLQTMRSNIDNMIVAKQNMVSSSIERRRISIYGRNVYLKIERLQNKHFPRWAKLAVFTSSLLYCILLFITIIIQSSLLNKVDVLCTNLLHNNTKVLWHDGCIVKTPFCKNLFQPYCDCAVIDIKTHNVTTLPNGIVEMTNLRKLAIRNGPLRKLPMHMEKLNKLRMINFEFNQLQNFDVDISKFTSLNRLILRFNEITSVHTQFWKHETLTMIEASSNIGLPIPTDPNDIYLPNVYYIDIRNNSVYLPPLLGNEQLPSVAVLLINGNKMPVYSGTFNFETLENLAYLSLSEMDGLTTLPSYLANFEYLRYIDARNNNLTSVPNKVTKWLKEKNIEAYFSGNDILCKNDVVNYGKYCEMLCSKYCWSKNHVDGHCDPSCNSEKCHYDGGDCDI